MDLIKTSTKYHYHLNNFIRAWATKASGPVKIYVLWVLCMGVAKWLDSAPYKFSNTPCHGAMVRFVLGGQNLVRTCSMFRRTKKSLDPCPKLNRKSAVLTGRQGNDCPDATSNLFWQGTQRQMIFICKCSIQWSQKVRRCHNRHPASTPMDARLGEPDQQRLPL